MTNAPRGRNSPDSACFDTCSGRTQYALPLARPADHALLYTSANSHASPRVTSEARAPSLTTVEGAPWTSAWAYRSPSFRCFFTSWSFVRASRPPRIRWPSDEIVQRYASNHIDFVALTRGRFAILIAFAWADSISARVAAIASSTRCAFMSASLRRSYRAWAFAVTSWSYSNVIASKSPIARVTLCVFRSIALI